MATTITEADYREREDLFEGYCTSCKDWTRDQTEADAEGYDCPECGEHTVVGAMTALFEGLLEVVDE